MLALGAYRLCGEHQLYMAALTRDAADALGLGDALGDAERFDAAMSVFTGEAGLEVEKAWCAVNAILRQDIPDLDPFWIGEPVTDDLGYGPACFAPAEVVRQLAPTLAGLSTTEALQRLDAAIDADEIYYPAIWDRGDEDAASKQWAVDATMEVIALYERAALNNLGMLAMLL